MESRQIIIPWVFLRVGTMQSEYTVRNKTFKTSNGNFPCMKFWNRVIFDVWNKIYLIPCFARSPVMVKTEINFLILSITWFIIIYLYNINLIQREPDSIQMRHKFHFNSLYIFIFYNIRCQFIMTCINFQLSFRKIGN